MVGRLRVSATLEGDAFDVEDALGAAELLHDGGFEGGIELDDGEGATFGAVSSEGEIGDVCAGIAEGGANDADDAGAVVVFDDEEVALDVGVDVEFVDFHDARGSSDDGAGDAELFAAFGEFDDDEFAEFGGGIDD